MLLAWFLLDFFVQTKNMAGKEKGIFKISPLQRPSGLAERFYSKVTNKMKDDMKEAIGRLGGEYKFSYKSKQGTIVDGKQRGPRRELGMRIDIQEYFMEAIDGEDRQIADVQIQLNGEKRHSTIAQVHFQCGETIPGNVLSCAFEKSFEIKRTIIHEYI